jgi:hypothetical protein
VLRDLCSDDPRVPAADTERFEVAKDKLKKIVDAHVPGGAETVAAYEAAADQLGEKFPQIKDRLKAALQDATAPVSKLEVQIEKWFDTVMNRLSDIFTRSTRVMTICVSALLVIVLHIDSGEIVKQITNSPEIRSKLTTLSDRTMAEADKVFDNNERAAAALANVRANHKDTPKVVEALDQVKPHLTRCVDGRNAVAEQVKLLPNAEALQAEFARACQEVTGQAMGSSYDQIRGLRTDLEKTSLKVVPAEVGGVAVFDCPEHWLMAYCSKRHLVGTLASILLLSLGAPFWFNTLRQLSNLKPAIDEKVGTRKSGESATAQTK